MAHTHPTQPSPGTDVAGERGERQRQRDALREAQDPAPRAGSAPETRGARFARKAHRTRLHLYAVVAVVVLVYAVALAASNTAHVKVNWVFGSSSVALVWLVLFSAVLGWLLGMLISVLFRWRTRAP